MFVRLSACVSHVLVRMHVSLVWTCVCVYTYVLCFVCKFRLPRPRRVDHLSLGNFLDFVHHICHSNKVRQGYRTWKRSHCESRLVMAAEGGPKPFFQSPKSAKILTRCKSKRLDVMSKRLFMDRCQHSVPANFKRLSSSSSMM